MTATPCDRPVRARKRPAAVAWFAALVLLSCAGPALRADDGGSRRVAAPKGSREAAAVVANQPADAVALSQPHLPGLDRVDAGRTLQTVVLFGVVSLAPVGLLMITAFVRIQIVLTLLRQAMGSPQVPGNQVVLALSLLLTALVMWPVGETVYHNAIAPYAAGRMDVAAAWEAGSRPIKTFMVDQIVLTRHSGYLRSLAEYAAESGSGKPDAIERPEDYSFRVVAPAFLLSEVTTGLLMGFYLYLPFLVVDLVVSSVLAATGLFMLPPALVSTPIKLILFVLADGWVLVATMLLSSFGAVSGR